MSERLITFLLALSPRERWLLAGLFGLALPLAVGFLWVAPLNQARIAAAQDFAVAQDLQAWVQARAAENAVLAGNGLQANVPSQSYPPIGISGIEESLKGAGLREAVTRLANRDGEAIELRFDLVDFRQLTDWLAETQPDWGYDLQAFRFERAERAGLVAAEFLLGFPK
ncbi:MAG: type II secretion system protein M [Rhodobacteraceae bacterium]|nr:type II secretion system protein M [Paracoccaceae bacterium]